MTDFAELSLAPTSTLRTSAVMTDFAELRLTPTSAHESDEDVSDTMRTLRSFSADAGFKEAQFLPAYTTCTAETTGDADILMSRLQAFYKFPSLLKDHDDTLVCASRPRLGSKMPKVQSNYPRPC